MSDAAALAQPQAAAIIAALAATLRSANPRAKLSAAKLILRWAAGPAGGDGRAAETVPADGRSPARLQQAVDLLRRLLPGNRPNPAATSCPARHEAGPTSAAPMPPSAPATIDPAPAPTTGAGAARATTPCPAADTVPPGRIPSPLAAPPGTESLRRDADPMSRALLLASHRSEDAFRRPLPQPPPVEPTWHLDADWWRYRSRRWR